MSIGDYVHIPGSVIQDQTFTILTGSTPNLYCTSVPDGEVLTCADAATIKIAPQYNMTHLQYKKLVPNAIPPQRSHAGDLGYDLFACEPVTIYPGMKQKVSTGIAFEFPCGWGGFVKDRSSMVTNTTLEVIAGVIDNGYTGELFIMFANYGNEIETIEAGQKIAQVVLIPVGGFDLREIDQLETADGRGSKGFGSTDK